LRPVDGPSGLPGLLSRLAAALRGHIAPLPLGALPGGIGGARFMIRRYGTRLTTWEPRHDGPGRLRLRHEAARRDRVRLRRVERLLAQAPGVTWVRPDGWTGRLVVAYDPGRVEAEYLVYLAERALEDPDAVPALALAAPAAPARLGLASTMVGVATLADLGVTALMPVSAALLVGT